MIRVGETYVFNGQVVHGLVFVVIEAVRNYRMSDRDTTDRPGFRILILEGGLELHMMTTEKGRTVTFHKAGDTIMIAERSAISYDSVRFPSEE